MKERKKNKRERAFNKNYATFFTLCLLVLVKIIRPREGRGIMCYIICEGGWRCLIYFGILIQIYLQTSDSLSSIRTKGRLSQSQEICQLTEQTGNWFLLLDSCNTSRGCSSGSCCEVRPVMAEVLLNKWHYHLGEEFNFSTWLLKVIPSCKVVWRSEDFHGRCWWIQIHDQPVQEVVCESVIRVLGSPVPVRITFRLVQVVTLTKKEHIYNLENNTTEASLKRWVSFIQEELFKLEGKSYPHE